jgi:hypothetical protein
MLLKGAANRGFLLTSKDFEMLKPMFSVSHDTQILIEENNLPFLSKFELFWLEEVFAVTQHLNVRQENKRGN